MVIFREKKVGPAREILQFTTVTGLANPSNFPGVVNGPVEQVNWYHGLVFCNKLSMREGLTPAYTISATTTPDSWGVVPTGSSNETWDAATCSWGANGYRLPTEAEWQWAAMGATDSPAKAFSGSTGSNFTGDYAWSQGNSQSTTHAVGGRAANKLGIYDMSGNVLEWCWDWYGTYPSGAQNGYSGPPTGSLRLRRGDSWADGDVAVANRSATGPYYRSDDFGLRVVRP
ncbi:MAG: formylglycine-generating enzyme family protein [Terrimicrobiaceae bacterium]